METKIINVNNVKNKTKLNKVRKDIKIVHERLKGFKRLLSYTFDNSLAMTFDRMTFGILTNISLTNMYSDNL